jgi:flagellar basal-body rod modification protein FlgD
MLAAIGKNTTENTRVARNSGADSQSLGQGDFLKLLTTQLVNQSPLNPMDNEAFMGQMAQFSTVSGISEMNVTLKQLASRLESGQFSAASTLIGKSALAAGGSILLEPGKPVTGALDVPENTASVVMTVANSKGQTIRQMTFNTPAAGPAQFGWDGADDAGNAVPEGHYTLAATARVNGRDVALTPSLRQSIVGASLPAGGTEPTLQLANGQSLAFSSLTQISR